MIDWILTCGWGREIVEAVCAAIVLGWVLIDFARATRPKRGGKPL